LVKVFVFDASKDFRICLPCKSNNPILTFLVSELGICIVNTFLAGFGQRTTPSKKISEGLRAVVSLIFIVWFGSHPFVALI